MKEGPGFRRSVTLAVVALWNVSAWAAIPPSGTLSQSSTQTSWTGRVMLPTASGSCGGPSSASCDNYKLTIVPPPYSFKLEIILNPGAGDYDLELYGPTGTLLDSSGNEPGFAESVSIDNPPAGIYTVSAAPFAAVAPYNAIARIVELATSATPPEAPRYANYKPPQGIGQSAGEPTLGVNERTGAVMYVAGTETLKVDFDDCSSPATAAWKDVSALWTSAQTFDPILFTDQALGRTFVSQLLPSKVSLMAFSDSDGLTSWWPSQGAGFNSGVDHQSLGGGPFAPGLLKPLTSYPHILYYCSQDIGLAQCATSLDGGMTFGPAVPIYNISQCDGIHGHVKVGPDGTAYVPNKNCGGSQGLAVSRDNGLTWSVKTVPGSTAGPWDPSVGIATDGTVYFGWVDGSGHPLVAVSHDNGDSWTNLQDVGTAFGIENIAFPTLVAGDGDRAAFAFLGTTTEGDAGSEDPAAFTGIWHLYIAHTWDGGENWVTINATPGDPVQRGPVCDGGTLCGTTRNLLDFIDATADARGRVLVGYADGCVGGCASRGPNSYTNVATIARQMSGRGLYASFDRPAGLPAAPAVEASQADGIVHISWSAPDDNGFPILRYRISRRPAGGAWEQIAEVSADTHSFDDIPTLGTTYSYRVKAVNAQGEGPACREVIPAAAPAAGQTCEIPGARVADDDAGDSPLPALDVEALSIAEPPTGDEIVLTLEVADLATFTPGNTWMILWNRPLPDATYDRNYVAMRATGPGTATFHYGKISPPNVNQGTDLGTATGSFSPDGTITFTITPDQADGVEIGQDLSAVEVRTFAVNVSGMPVTQATAIDFTASGNYTLAGSDHCSLGNDPPIARDDAASTPEAEPVPISVLENDEDPDGDSLAVITLSPAAHGRVTGKREGQIFYQPDAGFTGIDQFTYTVSDGRGHSATATVRVTVGFR